VNQSKQPQRPTPGELIAQTVDYDLRSGTRLPADCMARLAVAIDAEIEKQLAPLRAHRDRLREILKQATEGMIAVADKLSRGQS
jgi:hypothetical protein